jgi:gliding motility-associated-like protein
MNVCKKNIFIVIIFVLWPTVLLYSEGTKQIMPGSNAKGQLCINKWRNDFAFYDAKAEFRFNISIANTSEKIRFGFGQVLDNSNKPVSNLTYQIKDSTGKIVYGPFPVPASGKGHISTHTDAITGPFTGGYDYLEIQPLITGNYYLEFSYPPPYVDDTRHYLEFFDITVVDASGTAAIDGRVWSKAWQFWTDNDQFYGKLMILSDDSIVTQVNCNGFHGGSFSFSSNKTGCDITGILSEDRQSRSGNHLYPQYKVFLNDPDSILFPTLTLTSGSITSVAVNPDCSGGADFNIEMVREGTIRILIKNNPAQGAQSEVVQIIRNVSTGNNTIPWDGMDVYGNPVPNGTPLFYSVTNLSGMTHLPLYDIENNANGLIVKQIRPKGEQMKIYWDDTQITGGTSNTTSGCINTGGCHTWSSNFGNNNTINSWWFVTGSEISDQFFISKKAPSLPVITGNIIHCKGTGSLQFSVAADPNSTLYNWNYSGSGVTLSPSGFACTLNFAADAEPGTLSVSGYNPDCGEGPATHRDILIEPLPLVTLASVDNRCYTAPGFKLEGGLPGGGIYFADGNRADSLYPYKEPEGWHQIVYTYTTPTGCANSDTTEINLYSGTECLGTVYFPNAFKPGNDSTNNEFRPVVNNISSFKMYVYNRWGQLLFSTDSVTKGWDGTIDGKSCPTGTYTFMAIYGLSLREDNMATQRGVFVLIR